MTRLRTFLGTPFGLALLACLGLAGWALWSAGAGDVTNPVARQVRTSSVYAAPSYDLDQERAERILGNRRVVVALLEPEADMRAACDGVKGAADGNVVLFLSPDADREKFDHYGCALLPDGDSKGFGRRFVAEMIISRGVGQFVDQPLNALKVVAVNYDLLVRSGTVPDGARIISPSLPRYLVAAAALSAVVLGSTGVYLTSLRAGRVAARRQRRRDAARDERSALSANAAVLAQRIIDLDRRVPAARRSELERERNRRGRLANRYRAIASDFAVLLRRIAEADARGETDRQDLVSRVDELSRRCDDLERDLILAR
ncbi:hypothetical protein [Actinoalloteichus spitiensis]|uniref:hypothetical protein n=1 Tax=Actinoalloteichus spitiensis TaxID=252394 RepID=UPI0003617E8D|nr:hypothetical protein [Actinoalloteichus spitiensis]